MMPVARGRLAGDARALPPAGRGGAARCDELPAAINAMLATLGASHTRYYTIDDPAYYQLADIFAGAFDIKG